jgi:hypothetical protein
MNLASRVRSGVWAATLDAVRVGDLTTVWVGRSDCDAPVLGPSEGKVRMLEGKR